MNRSNLITKETAKLAATHRAREAAALAVSVWRAREPGEGLPSGVRGLLAALPSLVARRADSSEPGAPAGWAAARVSFAIERLGSQLGPPSLGDGSEPVPGWSVVTPGC